MKKLISILIIIIIGLSSCENYEDDIDQLQLEINQLKNIQNLLELKNSLYQTIVSEKLAIEIFDDEKNIKITFEDGSEYIINKKLISSYEIDYDEWKLNFNLSDSTSISIFFIGNEFVIQNLKLNPFNSAPLSLTFEVETPIKGKFLINVLGQDGPKSDILIKPDYNGNKHKIEVFGLYPNYENKIEIKFINDKGFIRKSQEIKVKTEKLPDGFPKIDILKEYDQFEQNTLILVNYRIAKDQPFMVDPFGKIRWYSNGFSEVKKYGLQIFKNGNIGFGLSENGQGKIFEYSMTGQLIKIYDLFPEFENIHHDVYEMPNGNFLVTANKVGIDTIEDHIVEVDRNSGSILNVWDLRKVLPTDRYTFRKIRDGSDWFHINAVIYDSVDNSIIVSGQAQGVVKLSWKNELKWILAPHDGWDDEFKNFLLDPNVNDFEWAFGQHAPLILPNGNLMLFDNGFGRNFSNELKYSRVVEYKINESDIGGTISQEWSYGKERGLEMFSPIISDVDYLEKSSSVFLTAGAINFNLNYKQYPEKTTFSWDPNETETRIIEVDRNKEVLFEMVFTSSGQGSTYRSEKLILD